MSKFVISLEYSCDFVHGGAWFAWASLNDAHIQVIMGSYNHLRREEFREDRAHKDEYGFGFHKENKFTAVRNAINDLYKKGFAP